MIARQGRRGGERKKLEDFGLLSLPMRDKHTFTPKPQKKTVNPPRTAGAGKQK